MSARMANTFYDTLTVLDAISKNRAGCTTGQIQKLMPVCTMGQVKRMIVSLEMCGFIHGEILPHGRTGKTVYHMNENAAIMLSAISRQHMETYQ